VTPVPSALLEAIAASRLVLVTSHVRPDGDAVGSLLGLGQMLRLLDKDVTLTLQDPVPGEFWRLPGADAIVPPDAVRGAFDTVIVVDSSSPDRMGTVWRDAYADLPLLVIDHHVTNTLFGTVNWVAADNAATCQMLVTLADALNLSLQPDLAQCLLAGLVTDTLCFRTSNTTADVLAAGMRMLQNGAVLTDITETMLDQRPFSVLRLWGQVLDGVQSEDGVIWAAVSRAALAATASPDGEDGSLSSLLIRTKGADISVSFLEKLDPAGNPQVECSFRARRGFDISTVALQLGGGGHPAAAGCTVPGTLAETAALVVPLLKAARQAQVAERAPTGPALGVAHP
jgi:bifunctional oligoribonuclease and PAP phosphatase NrnA